MITMQSIAARVMIGKIIGLVVGLIYMAVLPLFNIPMLSMFGLGSILMFMLMGVMTGFMGIFDRHPLFNFSMPWWIRGSVVGGSFMLMYILFTYETLEVMIQSPLISWTTLSSPFWALLDGVFVGMIMGYIETRIAGEGEALPAK